MIRLKLGSSSFPDHRTMQRSSAGTVLLVEGDVFPRCDASLQTLFYNKVDTSMRSVSQFLWCFSFIQDCRTVLLIGDISKRFYFSFPHWHLHRRRQVKQIQLRRFFRFCYPSDTKRAVADLIPAAAIDAPCPPKPIRSVRRSKE